jgi:2,3-bisphosphoglycerate-independent phosphoglycerate mutase
VVTPSVLVILDGASEPWSPTGSTSLERARTPALDALACAGTLARVRTVPPGLPAGSETAIPVLLGWTPPGRVDRGAIEAAAHAIEVGPGARAWRVDVVDADGRRADDAGARRAAAALRSAAPAHVVHARAGHRLLVVGPEPLPGAARVAPLVPWPEGTVLPRILDTATVVVAARGAAAGIAALLGAHVELPEGATGGTNTDLTAKAAAAVAALHRGASQVVVHVGGADEAAHLLDPAAKVAFLERADRELIAPLAAATARAGGTLRVCPDHGCDPATGAHDAGPVPHLTWRKADLDGARPCPGRRLTERAVAALDVTDAGTIALVAA